MPKWSFSKNWPPFKSPSSKMGPDPVCARFSRSMKTSSKARRGYQRPLSSDALNFPFTTSPLRKNKATSLCLLFAQQHFHEHFLSACDARARDTKLFPRMHSHILSAASKIQERNLTPQQQECAYIGTGFTFTCILPTQLLREEKWLDQARPENSALQFVLELDCDQWACGSIQKRWRTLIFGAAANRDCSIIFAPCPSLEMRPAVKTNKTHHTGEYTRRAIRIRGERLFLITVSIKELSEPQTHAL